VTVPITVRHGCARVGGRAGRQGRVCDRLGIRRTPLSLFGGAANESPAAEHLAKSARVNVLNGLCAWGVAVIVVAVGGVFGTGVLARFALSCSSFFFTKWLRDRMAKNVRSGVRIRRGLYLSAVGLGGPAGSGKVDKHDGRQPSAGRRSCRRAVWPVHHSRRVAWGAGVAGRLHFQDKCKTGSASVGPRRATAVAGVLTTGLAAILAAYGGIRYNRSAPFLLLRFFVWQGGGGRYPSENKVTFLGSRSRNGPAEDISSD